MAPAGIRFRPPPLAPTPEIRWLLRRAFGPVDLPPPAPVDPARAVELARRFEVSARIAARAGAARLGAELGPEAAEELRRDRLAAVVVGMRLEELARELAGVAAELSLPLVFLKFMALRLAGVLAEGSRSAGDLDVLVPAGRAAELQQALVARGCRAADLPASEHQLPPLVHPTLGIVEIHPIVLGVRLAGERGSATAEALAEAGLLAPCADLPGRAAVPAREVLAAHALVHGLGQHGHEPGTYSPLKMLADLADLGLAGPGGELARRAAALVARDLSAAEALGTAGLCAALAAGEPPERLGAAEDLVLRHALAGRLDPDYQRTLKLGLFGRRPSDRAHPARLAGALWHTLVLTRGQVDAIYGPPRRPLGYLGRRLARPFDLLVRLLRYGASAREVGRRRR